MNKCVQVATRWPRPLTDTSDNDNNDDDNNNNDIGSIDSTLFRMFLHARSHTCILNVCGAILTGAAFEPATVSVLSP